MSQTVPPHTTADSSQTPPSPDHGLPRTPYAIAAFVFSTVIGGYSYLFSMFDRSQFPETFANSYFWFLLSLIFLAAAILASLVTKTRRRSDSVIVIGLFFASACSLFLLLYFDRQSLPSESRFTVVLYIFTNHTASENLGESFRDNLKRDLEARFQTDILVLNRDREVKGERVEEKLAYARKWGSRRAGCHLAVWAELSTDKDGASYLIDMHFVGVRNFGSAVNKGAVTPLQDVYRSYVTQEALGAAVTEQRVGGVVSMVSLLYGQASYYRADYKSALQSLSDLDMAAAQFFAGQSAFLMATDSLTKSRQLFLDAEAYYLRAIELDPEREVLGGRSYERLGQNYLYMHKYSVSHNPHRDLTKAVNAFSQAADVYKKRGESSNYAYALVRRADALFDLSALETDRETAERDLSLAKSLLDEAFLTIDVKSSDYSEAQNILGSIYASQGQFLKAIEAHGKVLHFIPADDQHFQTLTLTLLGHAQTDRAWQTNDKSLYDTGRDSLRQAAKICEKPDEFLLCYQAHMFAGEAGLNWASKLRAGSPDWTTEIEGSITEFQLSINFVSKVNQPSVYARLRELLALSLTERASTAKVNERARFLSDVLVALSDGIDALAAADLDAGTLYLKRAECYERLALDADDLAARGEYALLSRKDRASARQWEVDVRAPK